MVIFAKLEQIWNQNPDFPKFNSIFFKTALFSAHSTHVGTHGSASNNPQRHCQWLVELKGLRREKGLKENFRTISNLLLISEVFGKIICEQLTSHLENFLFTF